MSDNWSSHTLLRSCLTGENGSHKSYSRSFSCVESNNAPVSFLEPSHPNLCASLELQETHMPIFSAEDTLTYPTIATTRPPTLAGQAKLAVWPNSTTGFRSEMLPQSSSFSGFIQPPSYSSNSRFAQPLQNSWPAAYPLMSFPTGPSHWNTPLQPSSILFLHAFEQGQTFQQVPPMCPTWIPRRSSSTSKWNNTIQATWDNQDHDDGWAWRKYGQRQIKKEGVLRNYYHCRSSPSCKATKRVDHHVDPTKCSIIDIGEHNHPAPVHRRSMAGRSKRRIPTYPRPSSSSYPTVVPAQMADPGNASSSSVPATFPDDATAAVGARSPAARTGRILIEDNMASDEPMEFLLPEDDNVEGNNSQLHNLQNNLNTADSMNKDSIEYLLAAAGFTDQHQGSTNSAGLLGSNYSIYDNAANSSEFSNHTADGISVEFSAASNGNLTLSNHADHKEAPFNVDYYSFAEKIDYSETPAWGPPGAAGSSKDCGF